LSLSINDLPTFQSLSNASPSTIASSSAPYTDSINYNYSIPQEYFPFEATSAEEATDVPVHQSAYQYGYRLPASQPSSPARTIFPTGQAFISQPRPRGATFSGNYSYFNQQFGGSIIPNEQFSGPLIPNEQFGGPLIPNEQFSGPLISNEQFGGPLIPNEHFGAPLAPTTVSTHFVDGASSTNRPTHLPFPQIHHVLTQSPLLASPIIQSPQTSYFTSKEGESTSQEVVMEDVSTPTQSIPLIPLPAPSATAPPTPDQRMRPSRGSSVSLAAPTPEVIEMVSKLAIFDKYATVHTKLISG
jgi:hypothetical protein